jgi:hypothetical protein
MKKQSQFSMPSTRPPAAFAGRYSQNDKANPIPAIELQRNKHEDAITLPAVFLPSLRRCAFLHSPQPTPKTKKQSQFRRPPTRHRPTTNRLF